jgi:inner membrane protein
MYRTGHYGVSLLVFAPLGFALVVAGHPEAALAGGAVVLGLTPLPDYDQRVPLLTHRGVTHTVLFAMLVGAAVGGVGWLVAAGETGVGVAPPVAAAAGFAAGALAIGAHLLGDVLTPAGIEPLWPLSSRNYSLSVTTAANPVANYLLFGAGVFVTAVALAAARSVVA